MNDRFLLNTRGDLIISHVFPTGESIEGGRVHNALQKTGRAATARSLAVPGASINRMYFLFSSPEATPVALTGVADGEVVLDTIKTSSSTLNFCRVPVIHVSTASTEGFGENIVTFHGVTEGSATGAGTPLVTGCKLYAVALACSTGATLQGDIIFSVANILEGETLSPILKIANAQFGIRWQISVL